MGEVLKSFIGSLTKGKRLRYSFLLFFLFISICYLCVFIIPIRASSSQSEVFLPVSLHSVTDADYGFETGGFPVPAISLNIIREVLGDQRPRPIDVNSRMATVTAILIAPIPTATFGPNSSGGAIIPTPTIHLKLKPTTTQQATGIPATPYAPPAVPTSPQNPVPTINQPRPPVYTNPPPSTPAPIATTPVGNNGTTQRRPGRA